jgi:hypothetical protein
VRHGRVATVNAGGTPRAAAAATQASQETLFTDAGCCPAPARTGPRRQYVHTVRDNGHLPLALTFTRLDGELPCHANDDINSHSRTFNVSAQGRMQAIER